MKTRFIDTPIFKAGIGLASLLWLIAMMAPYAGAQDAEPKRIVTIGGSLTEIVYALGAQDRLLARDSTSTYPPAAKDLTDIGYIRALSPEGVLSVDPDMILSLEGAGPPEALAVLKQAGIPFIEIPEGYDRGAISAKILAAGRALKLETAAQQLSDSVEADLEEAEDRSAAISAKRRVLFILSTRGGRIMAGGADTHAHGIIELAGGINAMASVSGYKQVTDEAVIEAKPDVILMMSRGSDHGAANDELFQHPAIAPTPAAKAGSIIRMDGLYMLGFGPRTAAAALELNEALYGEAAIPGN